MTAGEVKILARIEPEINDTLIEAFIPAVEDFIYRYTRDNFPFGIPEALKLIAARMVKYNLSNNIGTNIKSESLADYSVTYGESVNGSYPADILRDLEPFVKRDLKFH